MRKYLESIKQKVGDINMKKCVNDMKKYVGTMEKYRVASFAFLDDVTFRGMSLGL